MKGQGWAKVLPNYRYLALCSVSAEGVVSQGWAKVQPNYRYLTLCLYQLKVEGQGLAKV